MKCSGTVVHAQTFVSKNGELYTKLFVPVGYEVIQVFASGDLTALAGCDDVPFRLGVKYQELKLYYDGEED